MLLKPTHPTFSNALLAKAQILYAWGKSNLGEDALLLMPPPKCLCVCGAAPASSALTSLPATAADTPPLDCHAARNKG